MPVRSLPNSPAASPPSSPSSSSMSLSLPPSTRRAKLRSPAHLVDRLGRTNGSGKGSSTLPMTIRYLQQLSFRVISGRSSATSSHVRYVLLVQRKQDELPWTVSRPLSDYRALQKRLLAAMQLGHFCNADCPWLYSFVKSNFPKDFRLLASSKFVVGKRVDALAKCFATLHAHLIDRRNHCCSIMTSAVATELIEFINTDLLQSSDAHWSRFSETDASRLSADFDLGAVLPPLDIFVRPATDLSNVTTMSARSARSSHCSVCNLCSPKYRRHSSSSSPSPREQSNGVDECGGNSAQSSTSKAASDPEHFDPESSSTVLSTLSCGHQFHDECIVPRLNKSMRCPTCGHAQAFC